MASGLAAVVRQGRREHGQEQSRFHGPLASGWCELRLLTTSDLPLGLGYYRHLAWGPKQLLDVRNGIWVDLKVHFQALGIWDLKCI